MQDHVNEVGDVYGGVSLAIWLAVSIALEISLSKI